MKMLQNSKKRVAPVLIVLAAVLFVGGTFALLRETSATIRNLFDPGLVNVVVEESFEPGDIFEGSVVKQVRFQNCRTSASGDGELDVVPAYVRAQLVSTWMRDVTDEQTGEIQTVVVPVDTDTFVEYQLNLNSSSESELAVSADVEGSWVLGDDGFYYFTAEVAADAYTDYLLEAVSGRTDAAFPEEGYLEVNVLVDAVQGRGVKAVNDAWNHPTVNGEPIYP